MITIAIDGPSGAGKSTIAKEIACKLGIIYLDTGAMYRVLGLKALKLKVNPNDEAEVSVMLKSTEVKIAYEGAKMLIYLDGVEVSSQIRQNEVSMAASNISKHKEVRLKMVAMQREIAEKNSVVLDGRDIGTYVLPYAKNKFFITATSSQRAIRRQKELLLKGESIDVNTLEQEIVSRDYNDMNREFAPLKQASDAVVIDTTFLTVNEVVSKMLELIRE